MQTVVNGVLTNYEDINPKAAKTVIILHGWGQNSTHWLPLAKQLKTTHRYILLDLPGFGGTKNLAKNVSVPDYSEFVKDFAEKLKIRKFILAGQSFGGQIAADFSLRYHQKLERLILIDAAVVRVRSLKTRVKILLTKTTKPISTLLPKPVADAILRLYTPKEYVTANEYQRGVLRQIVKYDLSRDVHLIKVPTEIIWGSEDKVIPYMGKFLVEKIPNANLHLIYGAGHQPHLSHTTKTAVLVNKILADEPA